MDNIANANANNRIKTYRHEFGKEFMANLSCFSKVHQYDDRHTYKSEWTKWTQQEEIAQAIDIEKRRLQENGYVGDIDDKMFKAGRYYFRKKTTTTSTTTTTPRAATPQEEEEAQIRSDNNEEDDAAAHDVMKTQQRRPYITMSKDAIRLMDEHIASMRNAATATDTATATVFKPSLCYDSFYQTKMASPEMTKEIETIIEKYEKNASAAAATKQMSPDDLTNEIIDKIKKTYKNRYYKFASNQNA
jgi:hypothetical protein